MLCVLKKCINVSKAQQLSAVFNGKCNILLKNYYPLINYHIIKEKDEMKMQNTKIRDYSSHNMTETP